MKDPCALVSYCCKVNDTENKLRKEVLDGISETIEDIRSHDGLGALDCENKNVFLIRNCEFEGFKLIRQENLKYTAKRVDKQIFLNIIKV